MKFRPILFSTPMVLALLAGTKTQTRRIVKPQPIDDTENSGYVFSGDHETMYKNGVLHTPWQERFTVHCKYEVGDVLWVRETLFYDDHSGDEWCYQAGNSPVMCEPVGILKKINKVAIPSIHMPKAACRLFLEVTDIRVERLQDIETQDAVAEGIELIYPYWKDYTGKSEGFLDTINFTDLRNGPFGKSFSAEVVSYASLWVSINGADSWNANPYVWAVSFKVIDKPADWK